ncbi:TonB-dependent receptor [Lacihabitans sp. LS3-19]|uniref:TonB-dependent receptor domain-containing protein n=1 Tax=Lacihabitans sp. LS3-19 TaxID=2487335 RepID=UPI0020CF79F4|nr:TonB-dependent receptor [Lacihabitans sp. LS3-19]MCP9770504.1 TonB-dependent receptor [Lacihabitans sp. LS3-19]
MKIVFKFFTSILIFTSTVFAQNTGVIKGKLTDTKQPVEFATITLSKLPDSTKVSFYATSDSLGAFEIENIPFAEYYIQIRLVGFQNLAKTITFSEQSPVLDLGTINFLEDNNLLKDLVVTAQKSLIQKTNVGFVVNAGANLTQAGGTATDLLKNTPTVAVDADGGVTLRGKTPLILINGRNSNLSNLEQLPASSIETIEIITSASAKYDANAESGIINIVLKKNKADGTNGALAMGVGAGSRFRVNSSELLNHKVGKWNLGLAYDNRFAGRTRSITGDRTNYNLAESYFLNQDRKDERFERLQNLKLNIDYQFNSKNTLAFEAIGNQQGQDNDETLLSQFTTQSNLFTSGNDRHSVEIRRAKVAEFALNFNRSYEQKNKSLSASVNTSIENGKENTVIDTRNLIATDSPSGDYFYQKTHNYENGVISNAMLDFTQPIGSKVLLDMGYKGTFRSIVSDYLTANKVGNDYVTNTGASNVFDFNEQINAFYGLVRSVKSENSKLSYDLGLRAENVHNAGQTQDKSTAFTNDYLKLFPTANFVYNSSADGFWKLSYGKRINRPRLGQLNPFIDITDAFNPHSGNPNLQPEIIHALELGYNRELNKYSLTSNVFYRHSKNTIRSFFQEIGDGIVLNKPMNIGTADSYGIENILIGKPSSVYDFNVSASFFQQKLNASNIIADAVQSSFNWYGKVINNFAVKKGGKVQIIGNYTSATTTPQGRTVPVYFVDLAYQQKINSHARIALTAVDVFNTLKSGGTNYTSDFYSTRASKADTSAIMLTFAYSFNSAVKEKLLENKFSKEW